MNHTIKIGESLTKAEEIKLIGDFYNALPEDSYLKKLLIGIAEHCEVEITDDSMRAPMESIEYWKDQLKQAEAKVENNELAPKLQKAEQLLDIEKGKYTDIYNQLLEQSRQNVEIRKQLQEEQDINTEMRAELIRAREQVRDLKAELYDYLKAELQDKRDEEAKANAKAEK